MTSTTTAPTHKHAAPAKPAGSPNLGGSATHPANQGYVTRRRLGWPVFMASTLILLTLGLGYLQATLVSGIEINSHSWEQRVFSFRRDPLTGLQLSGVQYNPPQRVDLWYTVANPRAKKVDASIQPFLTAKSSTQARWDLVLLDDSSSAGARASILVDLLNALDSNYNPFWAQWTVQHPQRAAILWPAAQQLVEFDRYPLLPRLFAEALLQNSDEEFSRSVGHLVALASPEMSSTEP